MLTDLARRRASQRGETQVERRRLVRRVDLQPVRGHPVAGRVREVARIDHLQRGMHDAARLEGDGLAGECGVPARGVADLAAADAGHERDAGVAEQRACGAGDVAEVERVVAAAGCAVSRPDRDLRARKWSTARDRLRWESASGPGLAGAVVGARAVSARSLPGAAGCGRDRRLRHAGPTAWPGARTAGRGRRGHAAERRRGGHPPEMAVEVTSSQCPLSCRMSHPRLRYASLLL